MIKRRRIIIERPDLQSPLQRATSGGLTFIFWVIWLYLWLPLVSLVAWLAGIEVFREHMIISGGYEALLDIIVWYLLIIFLLGISLISWARYNLVRFRNKGRRKAPISVDRETLARDFHIDALQLAQWQGAKDLIIHHDKQGRITQTEIYTPVGKEG